MYPDQNKPPEWPPNTNENPRVSDWPPKDKPPMPDFANQPLIITKPKSPRRKIFLIVAAVSIALLGAGAVAYAVYNQSGRVLGDAISNMLTADTVSAKGEIITSQESQSGDFKIGFDVSGSDQSGYKTDIKVTANAAPITFDMSGSAIFSKEGDLYFKIDKAKEIIQNFLGASPQALERYSSLFALVDNKWVKVDSEDLSQDVNDSECLQKLAAEIKINKNLTKEIKNTYTKNQFITIERNLASESVSGVDSLHYKIRLDENRIKSFANALKQTGIYKKLEECDKSLDLNENDAEEFAKEANKENIEVWIGRWSHELTKLKVNGNADGTSYEVVAETTWNKPVNIEVPTEFTPWDKVMEEFQKVLQESFMPSPSQFQTLRPTQI